MTSTTHPQNKAEERALAVAEGVLKPLPSAADLDAVAAEAAAKQSTTPPTLDQIDEAIALYEVAKVNQKAAKKVVDDAEEAVVKMVDSFGHSPEKAERSKRLEGRRNVATVTRGTTISIDETSVLGLRSYLFDQKLEGLFPLFFAPETSHKLVAGAKDVLKKFKLQERVEQKIASLFGRTFDVKTNSPSLKVQVIKAEKPVRTKKVKAA